MSIARNVSVIAAAVFVALPITVAAETPSASRLDVQAQFGTLDTNANRLIDETEAKASKQLQAHFEQLDQNNDGQLSEAEFAGFEAAQSGKTVSDTKVKGVAEQATPPKPTESWFTAPGDKPGSQRENDRERESR